jgi:hypothetical protein
VTLILESAIHSFDAESAELAAPDPEALMQEDAVEFSLETIYRFASHYESLHPPAHPDWTCLPLHELESAALTGTYVAYTDHTLHDDIVIFADGDDHDFLSVDEFARTSLARQLRFWHPDCIPETYPDYYEAPFDDHEPPRHTVDPETFFDSVASYLERERDETLAQRRDTLADADPAARYADGDAALPALRSRGVSPTGELTLTIEFDRLSDLTEKTAMRRHGFIRSEFGIYPGDPVLLVPPSREHSPDALPIQATVEETSSTRVTVVPNWGDLTDRGVLERYLEKDRVGFGLLKLLNPLPYDRRSDAIDRLRTDETFREVLAGQRPLTFTQPRVAESTQQDSELNQEQQAATKYALLADDLFCIHGPPGTGKTRTLVEIVRRAVDAGEDVLVCADSNQAVDNILVGESTPGDIDDGSLHAYGQHGAGEFTVDRRNVRQSARESIRDWYGETPGRTADVVAATNGSAATIERQFALVVIDEATQATIATSAIPLTKAETAILAGDDRQLPPFSKSEHPPEAAVGRSLFEHLYADGGVFEEVGLQLRTQYRMHRDIAYFPNREFYDRTLRTGRDIEPLEAYDPILGYDIGGGEQQQGTSLLNPTEATLVGRLVSQVRDEGVPAEEIGVITPYTAQVHRIRDELKAADAIDDAGAVTVDTIDAFQGSERTVIIISLVRSNPDGDIGFLGRPADGPRRLNVAMTRAQRLCVLVGDWSTLTTGTDSTGDGSGLYGELQKFLADTGRMRNFDAALL